MEEAVHLTLTLLTSVFSKCELNLYFLILLTFSLYLKFSSTNCELILFHLLVTKSAFCQRTIQSN